MASLLQFPTLIPDVAAREQALDITQSFLIEAPAGSGKTGLLIRRFLKLLASDSVTDPAQVLAITFTRKATAEMLDRVLRQLAAPEDELAAAVLARDRQLGWNLLDNPHRLNIRTIDSISQEIANALPVLSGSGGSQSPTDDSDALYSEAARQTLMLLGGPDPSLNHALETLLLHRDGNLTNCEDLISSMLATRDQWGELVPLSLSELDEQYLDETVLPKLDKALDAAVCRALSRLAMAFPGAILQRLSELAAEMGHAEGYEGNPSPIALCAGRPMPPEEKSAHLDHWSALADLMLTKDGSFRAPRGINKRNIKFHIVPHHTKQLVEIIDAIRDDENLREILCDLRTLPPAVYPREQWQVTKALFRVLARALTELQLVFAERGECDFAEVGLLARAALRNDSALDDLSIASGLRLQHLLVDEMQDTSTSQYEFIQLLTRRWDGHSQTVFLVGDPKQSIYLFRQARVERFVQTMLSEELGDLPLTVLRLTANFRSQPQLVRAFNDDFSRMFPAQPDPEQPELVAYQPATAIRTGSGERIWHANAIPHFADAADRSTASHLQQAIYTDRIRALVEDWQARPLPPDRPLLSDGQPAPWKIAVLVRNRSHLKEIVTALKQSPPIPFRAVEIEALNQRQEILDLLALTRALLHPADRTAWLALLRTPWCGLSLADLHRLAGQDDRTLSESTIFELISVRGEELSEDGIARLQPFWTVIAEALRQRGRLATSQWVARTWRAFGTAAYLDAEALTNAERYFELLDELEEPGATLSLHRLHQKVAKLYAAPSTDPNAVDLMTLHKAKGLEWDVVLVPELHRSGRNNSSSLLSWLEMEPGDEEIAAGILAPIAGKGEATGRLNSWMRSIDNAREAAERKRLFYVACTRAREELHLFAAPSAKKDGGVSVRADSLLHAAWPAAEALFTHPAEVIEMPQRRETFDIAAATAPAPRIIRRIPLRTSIPQPSSHLPLPPHFERPEGSFAARAFGNAVHAFLDLLASRIAAGEPAASLSTELPGWQPRIAAVLRASGLPSTEVRSLAAQVQRGLGQTLSDPEGRWILAAHPQAGSEISLTGTEDGTIRLDRSFLAGATPLAPGPDHLWIVDYKTATHGPDGLEAFLEREREKYRGQLETYAQALATAETRPIRVALFYPMLPRLIWWEPGASR